MRRRARVDNTHPEIVEALRGVGCDVVSLAALGHGVPDLLAYHPPTRRWALIEVKSPGGTLTTEEAFWHERHAVPVTVAYSVEDALRAIGVTVTGGAVPGATQQHERSE